jgi:hypothetical protein
MRPQSSFLRHKLGEDPQGCLGSAQSQRHARAEQGKRRDDGLEPLPHPFFAVPPTWWALDLFGAAEVIGKPQRQRDDGEGRIGVPRAGED